VVINASAWIAHLASMIYAISIRLKIYCCQGSFWVMERSDYLYLVVADSLKLNSTTYLSTGKSRPAIFSQNQVEVYNRVPNSEALSAYTP
jgi:hypothetical protein